MHTKWPPINMVVVQKPLVREWVGFAKTANRTLHIRHSLRIEPLTATALSSSHSLPTQPPAIPLHLKLRNPMASQKYQRDSRGLLAQARGELAQGDLRQASEKGWGAAALMLKAIAEQSGWGPRAAPTSDAGGEPPQGSHRRRRPHGPFREGEPAPRELLRGHLFPSGRRGRIGPS